MAKEAWKFKLGGKSHIVAINHHEATGRAAFWVNGKIKLSQKWFVDSGEFTFEIDHIPCSVRGIFTGLDYQYTLLINGISLQELQKRMVQMRQIRVKQQIQPAQAHLTRTRQQVATHADKASQYWLKDNGYYEGDAYGVQNSSSAHPRTIKEISADETIPSREAFAKHEMQNKSYWADSAPIFLEENNIHTNGKPQRASKSIPNKPKSFFSRFFTL